jgi:hypothetical protein
MRRADNAKFGGSKGECSSAEKAAAIMVDFVNRVWSHPSFDLPRLLLSRRVGVHRSQRRVTNKNRDRRLSDIRFTQHYPFYAKIFAAWPKRSA